MTVGAGNSLNLFTAFACLAALMAVGAAYASDMWVEGYYDENGHYVEPHFLFRTQVKQFDSKRVPQEKSDLYYEVTNAHNGYVKRNPAARDNASNNASNPIGIEVPENARLNYFGTGWECVRGYIQQGETCEKIPVPENARLNPEVSGGDTSGRSMKSSSSYPLGIIIRFFCCIRFMVRSK